MRLLLLAACIGILLSSCGLVTGSGAKTPTPMPPPQTAAEAFHNAEEQLLTTRPLHISFRIVSTGAFTASFRGSLRMTEHGHTQLAADGTFGDMPMVLILQSDGETMIGGNGEKSFSMPEPAALQESLLIGLTRMGILHNLARLTAGLPPDRANGGVREWVVADDISYDSSGPTTLLTDITFSVHVAGSHAADAHVSLTNKAAAPIDSRRQTVTFPTGSMKVEEDYLFRSEGP